jgi:flagellar motility protein MotE (MotC chaperone)
VNPVVLSIVGSVIGLLLYLAVTAAVLIKGYKPPPPAPKPAVELPESHKIEGARLAGKTADEIEADPNPSWNFYNLEVDSLVFQLRSQADAFEVREKNLRELESRLAAERAELVSVTQAVWRLREDIDRKILKIQDDEAANVKRLAKTYGGMEPTSVAKILKELDEKLAVKILSQMKDDQNAAILDSLAKTDAQGAKAAASLSDRLRLVPTAKKP